MLASLERYFFRSSSRVALSPWYKIHGISGVNLPLARSQRSNTFESHESNLIMLKEVQPLEKVHKYPYFVKMPKTQSSEWFSQDPSHRPKSHLIHSHTNLSTIPAQQATINTILTWRLPDNLVIHNQ